MTIFSFSSCEMRQVERAESIYLELTTFVYIEEDGNFQFNGIQYADYRRVPLVSYLENLLLQKFTTFNVMIIC